MRELWSNHDFRIALAGAVILGWFGSKVIYDD